jgi:hypothetical protein
MLARRDDQPACARMMLHVRLRSSLTTANETTVLSAGFVLPLEVAELPKDYFFNDDALSSTLSTTSLPLTMVVNNSASLFIRVLCNLVIRECILHNAPILQTCKISLATLSPLLIAPSIYPVQYTLVSVPAK